MKKINRLLSCLLALALMLTLIPALTPAASAAGPTRTGALHLTISLIDYEGIGGTVSGDPPTITSPTARRAGDGT